LTIRGLSADGEVVVLVLSIVVPYTDG